MSDGLWLRYWRGLTGAPMLPRRPEPAEDEPREFTPGLIDETN